MPDSPLKLWGKVKEYAPVAVKAAAGEMQRALGLPITSIATHRQALEQWKQSFQPPARIEGRVLISALRNRPWIGVGVYASFVLRQMGYEPTLLYRSSVVRQQFPGENGWFSFWPGVKSIPGITLVDLDSIDVTPEEMREFEEGARASSPSVLAYDRHVEEQDILSGDEQTQEALKATIATLMRMGAATSKHLRDHKYQSFILYSGLIGESPMLLEAARRHGLNTACLEGWSWRHGHMLCNFNAPALDYDISGWLKRIQPWNAEKEESIRKYINFLDGKYQGGSTWLDDFYLVQRAQVASNLPPDIQRFVQGDAKIFLAATNVIGDSSMLRRETIFRSQQEWIAALVRYFRERPDAKLIIRAHPAEIWARAKVRVRMAEVARKLAAGVPNVYVVEAHEPLNSFTLLPFVSAGLVWLSSIGVDMVVRGVPVIAGANPKYGGMGIVEEPATQADYFALLESWVNTAPRPTEHQVLMAMQYQYIVFKGFSSEAWSRNSYAMGIRLNDPNRPAEHDTFYRELVVGPPAPQDMLEQAASAHGN